ncbi:MAG: hypothetical protein UX87_C0021G0007 [Candidatus Amesbacteria bacterium GW2011_GWA1_47_16]|uniref:YcxB-like C-terminal domain-containing protein n=1 Tax=Candidatus Amesbacteria bacterium GW2011_GWA1_47_16 TaxID=1618353 RepID=A0A0G1UBR9_9BACT|nr:MAG: hypothetical protein UX87_C0021G0007 [Candidatus Amesbacteria bacterium GW2011_GWA1_47_16]
MVLKYKPRKWEYFVLNFSFYLRNKFFWLGLLTINLYASYLFREQLPSGVFDTAVVFIGSLLYFTAITFVFLALVLAVKIYNFGTAFNETHEFRLDNYGVTLISQNITTSINWNGFKRIYETRSAYWFQIQNNLGPQLYIPKRLFNQVAREHIKKIIQENTDFKL